MVIQSLMYGNMAFSSIRSMSPARGSFLVFARQRQGKEVKVSRRTRNTPIVVPNETRLDPLTAYKPKNSIQSTYVDNMMNNRCSIVIAYGPAGTGKTLLACVYAVRRLIDGDVKRLIMTRPAVAVEGEELGFLPGDLIDKMSPYTQPLFDILHEFYTKNEVKKMLADGIIEVSPLAFMRGRTFKDAIIIADEMQNSTPNQMLMLATRVGSNSKLIITGDLQQSDRGVENGLSDLLDRLKRRCTTQIKVSDMSMCDVFRSKAASEIIDIYNDSPMMRGTYPSDGFENHIKNKIRKIEDELREYEVITLDEDDIIYPPSFKALWDA
jgi:phosphate starvation-inducible PhoH-like protein